VEQNDIAEATRKREIAEDTNELVQRVVGKMWLEGQLEIDVEPLLAIVDRYGVTVLMSDGSRLTIPNNTPDRARLSK